MLVTALEVIVRVLLILIALGLAYAVWASLRRSLVGARRSDTAAADPYSQPFGDAPTIGQVRRHFGFSRAELEEMARRSDERRERDPLRRSFAVRQAGNDFRAAPSRGEADGSSSDVPSGAPAVRDFLEPAIPAKGGHNDLGRWKCFGGTLERPEGPAPINRTSRGHHG